MPEKMKIIVKKKKTIEEESSAAAAAAQTIASIDDLLIEILLRLPMKSLRRFKSVSKHWLSLITDPQFALLRNPNPNPALGILIPSTTFYVNPQFDYIPFDVHNPTPPPFKKLKFTKDPSSSIRIVQSCNGLLLCANFRVPESKRAFYVYNPTIKQLTKLPKPRRSTGSNIVIHGVALAFDPAKSPHYKVVCVRDSEIEPRRYQIEIYSSNLGPWRASGGPFMADVDFETAPVYWNGAVHWVNRLGNMMFYVDEERLGVIPMPPIPEDSMSGRSVICFGESCDHLHLIETYGPRSQFNVYEMKRDFSEWFIKYRVDLAAVGAVFPEMASFTGEIDLYSFSIFSLIRGGKEDEDEDEDDDDGFLVLQIPGKAIRYNLGRKTFEKLCDFEGADEEEEHHLRYTEYDFGYQHIESLCCV